MGSRSRSAAARLLSPVLAAVSCAASAGGVVSFQKDVLPILNQHCVMCHMTGTELGDLSLFPDPLGNLVGMRSTQSKLNLVEPGKPEASYLMSKILGQQAAAGGRGLAMPWDYRLGAPEVELIRQWILQGAKDN
jgi:hypothetical protein